MGADVHEIKVLDLKNEEGSIVVLIQSWKKPTKKVVDETLVEGLRAEPMYHNPYCRGLIKVVKITDCKQILFCEGCGLRLEIINASEVKTIKDLRKCV